MSIVTTIKQHFDQQVDMVWVDKDAEYHGESATEVKVALKGGKLVEGTFTNEQKASFGGVQFESKKDIAALMISKIQAVLDGVSPEQVTGAL